MQADYDPKIRIYLAIGSVDDAIDVRSFTKLSLVLDSKRYKNLRLKWSIHANLNHLNVVAPEAQEGLRFLYGNG